ncbi:Cellulose synthase operon protein C C-terminus (BCSC_C) [Marinospirillum celere]|uniref:Cellulose synthase operon protein C C-terminus (BCSC_C) n=1 Tax=Marinospirillum celere TaxID=1122252 RepID=A0A1I1HJN0_9GAMM|nr:cellulose synthase subunit BcsC-related outer membrane protein [Marinospirillum celere]SFC21300.1 Cellulose synthase operon protein C C-terminus (BCSC_C) [Marinospirillum celere]
MNRILLTGLLLVQAFALIAAQPDLLQHQQWPEATQRQLTGDQYLRPAIPETGAAVAEVDTTGIWFHLRHGNRAQAASELNRLQIANPDWQPADELLQAFQQPKTQPEVTVEKTEDPYNLDMGRLAGISGENQAIRELSSEHLQQLAEQTLERQHTNNALLLGWIYLQRDEAPLALPLFQEAANWQPGSDAEDGLAASHFQLALQAIQAQQPEEALQQAGLSQQHGRTTAYADLGWLLYEAQLYAAAQTAFAQSPVTESSIYGQLLTLQAQQQYAAAENLACAERSRSQRLTEICDDLGPLLAWAAFEAADYRQAAERFDPLLTAAPENADYAFALEESLQRLNATAGLDEARQRHPLLRSKVSRLAFDRAWGRKQFDLAQRTRAASTLAGREDWQVTFGLKGRIKQGDRGLTRLTHYQPYVAATRLWDEVRMGVSLQSDHFRSGRPPLTADFGSQPDEQAERRALAQSHSVSPELSARHERDGLTLQGSFFTVHSGEAKDSQAYGQLQGDWYPDSGLVSLNLFRLPLEDSLLARQGARDPTSDRDWGQVADQGGRLLVALPIRDQASVAFSGTLASQQGRRVAGNDRKALRVDLARDFAEDFSELELDYLRLGPFVEWMSWDKNLSHFTLGQGGYYSPQQLWRLGLQLELLSAEARDWQLRVRTGLSWNWAREAESSRYPLDEDGQVYASSRSSGPGAELMLEGVWRASSHLLAGGYFGHALADDYRDTSFGLLVRVPLQSRHAVISADLPLSSLPGH